MNKIKIQNSGLLLLIPFAIFLFAVADAKIVHADNKVKLYFFLGERLSSLCRGGKIFGAVEEEVSAIGG